MPKRAKLKPCQTGVAQRGTAELAHVMAEYVLPCLDAQRALIFAQVCKLWRAALTTAPEAFRLALRCALLAPRGDGKGSHNYFEVLNLLDMVARGQIHPPSPLRLLRFATANRCELATCKSQTATERRVRVYVSQQNRFVQMATNLRHQHGIFACWDCTQSATNSVDVMRFKHDRALFADLLQPIKEPRATFVIYANHPFVWRTNAKTCPTLEHPAGEPIGPLVTYERVVSLGGAAATREWLATQPRFSLPVGKQVQVPSNVTLRLSKGVRHRGILAGEIVSIEGAPNGLIIDGMFFRARDPRCGAASVVATVNGQHLPACGDAFEEELQDVGPGSLVALSTVHELKLEAAQRQEEAYQRDKAKNVNAPKPKPRGSLAFWY